MKLFYEDNKRWIYLLRYVLLAVLFAIIAILIDSKFVSVLNFIPSIFLTSVELAKLILGTLAGALLTITTFTFSTIMVVLTMYSSNYSPRVVNNFLNDKISMKVLGIFVGGFLYCISTLFFMRNSISEYLVISATIGVIYSVFSIIYFIIFVYSVSSSIQASKLISRVYDESYTIIERALNYREDKECRDNYDIGIYRNSINLKSPGNGYLELVEFDEILMLLEEFECKLIIYTRIGEFVYKDENIATLYYNDEDIKEELGEKILKEFSLEEERMAYNDYQFSLQKIIDIALRALSPGINDPNTAIHCINILGVLLGKLGTIDGKYIVIKHEEAEASVIYEDFNFEKDLYYSFYQILEYGKKDISIVIALFDALRGISLLADDRKISTIREFRDYIYQSSKDNFKYKFDLEILEEKKNNI